MKKLISAVLLVSLLLAGCGGAPAETTAPATVPPTTAPATVPPTTVPPTEEPTEAPTEEPTEAPTEPPVIYTNPLTGEVLDAPQTTRIFGVSINNIRDAMPMGGVSQADLFFEMYINDYATRGLALFSDITQAEAIGSVRSLRYNFIDICQAYDAIVTFAGGDARVTSQLPGSGVPGVNAEYEGEGYFFRDKDRLSSGYAREHTLYVQGPETLAYAQQQGHRVTRDENQDFGLHFTEDGTPDQGENAAHITISLIHDGAVKKTMMDYDETVGKYLFSQYGKEMTDGKTGEKIFFENVIVILCPVYNSSVYHVADLDGSGDGLFACGGKIIPIKWIHEKETDPFTFTLTDGTPLELGVGTSYIAIAPLASRVEVE